MAQTRLGARPVRGIIDSTGAAARWSSAPSKSRKRAVRVRVEVEAAREAQACASSRSGASGRAPAGDGARGGLGAPAPVSGGDAASRAANRASAAAAMVETGICVECGLRGAGALANDAAASRRRASRVVIVFRGQMVLEF